MFINEGTKKARDMIESYNNSLERYGYRYLKDCYKHCSYDKEKAEADICGDMLFRKGGRGYTILSYNTFNFTCAYLYETPDNKTVLRVETRDNTYECYYE